MALACGAGWLTWRAVRAQRLWVKIAGGRGAGLLTLALAAISAGMGRLGGRYYGEARKAAGLPYHEGGKALPAQPARSPEEVEATLAKANPVLPAGARD